ncbi:MOSC domain-containing protein [Micromonospora sp. NPDC005113]
MHHDEGPVSLITTAALRRLTELSGGEPGGMGVDPLRFRANLLIDNPGSGFPEEGWPGRRLQVGPDVVLRPVRPLTRCVMIDMAQDRAVERNDLLKTRHRASRPGPAGGWALENDAKSTRDVTRLFPRLPAGKSFSWKIAAAPTFRPPPPRRGGRHRMWRTTCHDRKHPRPDGSGAPR